jgi:uncharacterized protein
MNPPFHLAFPITDIQTTRKFYEELLQCKVGRSAETWIDFDFYGHQLSAHVEPQEAEKTATNHVDGDEVPIRHFGVILEWDQWHQLADRLKSAGIKFLIEPHIRFKGKIGEQATMFFHDPSGNALEFKSFQDMSQVFAH